MVHRLDITREHCPMTMVKVKLKLAQIPKGDRLDVLLTGNEPLRNVPRTVEEQGYTVISTVPDGTNYHVVIEK